MAIITVEDGTGIANATSYVSVVDATAYLTERGLSFSGDISQSLINAMDFIESQDFIGFKLLEDQSLLWPRSSVSIDGFLLATDSIPQLLIDAQIEAAVVVDAGNDLLPTLERETRREAVGSIVVEYTDSAKQSAVYTKVTEKLFKLVHGNETRILRS